MEKNRKNYRLIKTKKALPEMWFNICGLVDVIAIKYISILHEIRPFSVLLGIIRCSLGEQLVWRTVFFRCLSQA